MKAITRCPARRRAGVGFAVHGPWRETESDAAMSMLWFDLWLRTADRRYLELAVEYNEDDCRATKRVKEWVEGVGGGP